MISDLQADIDQENEPDFSKFSGFVHTIHILILKLRKPHHIINYLMEHPSSDSTIGLPQTRRDKRQNGKRQRGRRGHNKEQRRQLREKLLLKNRNNLQQQKPPGWPWETFGSTWCKAVLSNSSFRDHVDAGDHRVGFESYDPPFDWNNLENNLQNNI